MSIKYKADLNVSIKGEGVQELNPDIMRGEMLFRQTDQKNEETE